jgi:hypothetical protein
MKGIKLYKSAINIGLLVVSIFMINGCHLAKRVVSGKVKMTEDANIVRKVINAQPDVKFLELRMTGKAEEDGNRIGFMGTAKIEKNKQIYILLRSTIGIELARVYANMDSVWIFSKMLNIKEKGDWKLAAGKIGYPVDFFAMQGILLQSLFTSTGDQIDSLISNLLVKNDKDYLRLVSNVNINPDDKGIKYFSDFIINRESFVIDGTKIRDIKGQWIADVKYLYNKGNLIKKIELKGIDSERNFAIEVNIVKRDLKDFIEINFDKF